MIWLSSAEIDTHGSQGVLYMESYNSCLIWLLVVPEIFQTKY